MDDRQFLVITDKLDKLLKLQALSALKEVESEYQKIKLLYSMDFRNAEIARILGKDPHNVDVVVSKIRKEGQKQTKQTQKTNEDEESTPNNSGV